jgi:hypothetical protein
MILLFVPLDRVALTSNIDIMTGLLLRPNHSPISNAIHHLCSLVNKTSQGSSLHLMRSVLAKPLTLMALMTVVCPNNYREDTTTHPLKEERVYRELAPCPTPV